MKDAARTEQEVAVLPPTVPQPHDEALLATMFVDRYDALVRFATAVSGSHDRGEDAVHEAFVRLFARPRRLRDRTAAEAYLRSAVLNAARSAGRRRRVVLRPRPPAADIAAAVADRSEVVAALQTLPRREREAVAFRFLLDLSERETAVQLRVSVGAVKGYTSRGLARLAQLLGESNG
jgi:RNA polymerase sigma factor (sigma-70 family)